MTENRPLPTILEEQSLQLPPDKNNQDGCVVKVLDFRFNGQMFL